MEPQSVRQQNFNQRFTKVKASCKFISRKERKHVARLGSEQRIKSRPSFKRGCSEIRSSEEENKSCRLRLQIRIQIRRKSHTLQIRIQKRKSHTLQIHVQKRKSHTLQIRVLKKKSFINDDPSFSEEYINIKNPNFDKGSINIVDQNYEETCINVIGLK
ncbi:hypothetical protein CEXT_281541 [Caerostris extrusa]|uniref:Uncharacterized protein n=1 Tax=Caerostris extrusa TaxID=172846 RepID=A0AAV4VWX8_CAEEX|nr:hypothetical protein CEXT_281541 [Caerostris extrusa]